MKEKTFSDPLEPLSEDANRAMLGCCELLAKDASDAKCMMDDIIRRAEENIRLYNDNNKYARFVRACYESKFGKPKEKDIMKEKKTKKMTKAEAFGYLTYKKVACYNGNEVDIQKKLFEIGFKWCDGTTVEVVGLFDFLLIDDGTFQFTDNVSHFRKHAYEEISVDDILSIEIVDEKKKSENVSIELEKWIGVIRDKFCCNSWSIVISASNFALFSGDLIEEKRIKE